MNCKICGNRSNAVFSKKVLHKYDITYYECSTCNFIQTEEPYWLAEAYESPLSAYDTGLVARNVTFAENVTALLNLCDFKPMRFLDHGGGNGMFVRMMRDNGCNFYWSDAYASNVYAQSFAIETLASHDRSFGIVSAFEVFEHLVNPIEEIEQLLKRSDSILFSTQLVRQEGKNAADWWYISPEHGQHISFYHKKTLKFIAEKFGLNLYTNKTLHLLTKRRINPVKYKLATTYKIARILNTLSAPRTIPGGVVKE